VGCLCRCDKRRQLTAIAAVQDDGDAQKQRGHGRDYGGPCPTTVLPRPHQTVNSTSSSVYATDWASQTCIESLCTPSAGRHVRIHIDIDRPHVALPLGRLWEVTSASTGGLRYMKAGADINENKSMQPTLLPKQTSTGFRAKRFPGLHSRRSADVGIANDDTLGMTN